MWRVIVCWQGQYLQYQCSSRQPPPQIPESPYPATSLPTRCCIHTHFDKPDMAPQRSSQWPWSRRQQIWDPPTLLDELLDSPLRAFISFVYAIFLTLRGAPFKPPRNKPRVKVVCLSDTHTNTLSVPNGDVLIHAGDLTNAGTVEEIQAQLNWLASLPHKEKIVIAGNHDSYFDLKSRKVEDKSRKLDFKGITYLENKAITLKFKGGRKINFYGSPNIPKCDGSDFA